MVTYSNPGFRSGTLRRQAIAPTTPRGEGTPPKNYKAETGTNGPQTVPECPGDLGPGPSRFVTKTCIPPVRGLVVGRVWGQSGCIHMGGSFLA